MNLRVINLNTLVTDGIWDWHTIEAPAAVTDDHILGGIIWPTTYEIAAHWLNRRQNYTVLRFCNVVTRECPVSIARNTPNSSLSFNKCKCQNVQVYDAQFPKSLLIKHLNAEISDCQKVKLYLQNLRFLKMSKY